MADAKIFDLLAGTPSDTDIMETETAAGAARKLTRAQVRASAPETKTAYEANSDTNAFTDAEQSKLAGVESGATADQTNGEVKTAYEANANTNAFTDAEQTKLAGVATGAIAGVVQDTTPALGGNLTMSGNALVTTANADVLLSPNGSGAVSVSEVADYEDNVTADDDVPNKKFCDDTYLKQTESLIIAAGDETTAATTGTAKTTFRMPYAFTVTEVRGSLTTAPTGSVFTLDINKDGTTILSTKLTIDATEKTSTTAATAAVISDSSLADDAEMTIDIDTIGSTIAGTGPKVTLIGNRT